MGVSKTFRPLIYKAHRAVIFAIIQLSCPTLSPVLERYSIRRIHYTYRFGADTGLHQRVFVLFSTSSEFTFYRLVSNSGDFYIGRLVRPACIAVR